MPRSIFALCSCAIALTLVGAGPVQAATAPPWMHAQVGLPLPAHDEKTNAILLFSEILLTVQPNGSMKRLERNAYKILRPDGQQLGMVKVGFDAQSRITSLHGWCIPASGRDYEVKEKDAVETSVGVENGELVSDLRIKVLQIPAATPGSIIGYEFEQEQRPYFKSDEWGFQEIVPVREAHYSLQLPPNWSYKAFWLNHAEETPTAAGAGKWQWTVSDIKPIRVESRMPPWSGIAARMVVALLPPSGQDSGLQSWRDVGLWYSNLTQGRRDPSPEIKRQVAELTASARTPLEKIQTLANFVQSNIRYVAIELGIGGYQPHRATEIFSNRFGDCKDKVTLLAAMLKEIGIDSYYVIINTERGSVGPATLPNLHFNHAVMAVALPEGADDPTLLARSTHPKLGKIVFFDPTDPFTAFGRLSGELQANYGMLVTPEGGELVQLPQLPTASSAIDRTAQMTLDEKGTLRGDIHEVWRGDSATAERALLRSMGQETDRIKPVERIAAASFTAFEIVKASLANLRAAELPFEWNYTIEASNYAKPAGNLLLVRPRVLGSKSSALLETKEPREHPVEFDRPQRDQDVFEIALPNGYDVDELPPPVNVDEGFIS